MIDIENTTRHDLMEQVQTLKEKRFNSKEAFNEFLIANEIPIKAPSNYNKDELAGILAAFEQPEEEPLPGHNAIVFSEPLADPDNIGAREVVRKATGVVRQEGVGGEQTIMRTTVTAQQILQPLLTLEEATRLGAGQWWPYRIKGQFTTVINGRRFIINEEVAAQLKNRGGGNFVAKPRR
jgi:hypothetical protein